MTPRHAHRLARTLFAAAGLAGALTATPVLAQNALGDGRALDRNQQVGSGGFNSPGRDVRLQSRMQNAIVTGNVAGGQAFRGSLGYSAENDFRADLGSNDLFDFERDSFFSGLAARNVRSIDALRQQMQFSTGLGPSADSARALTTPFMLDRAGTGSTAANLRPPVPGQPDAVGIDPFTARPRSLRATSEFLTANTLEPVYFAGAQSQEGQQLLIGATPLRGIVTTPAPGYGPAEATTEEATDAVAAPSARLDSTMSASGRADAEPVSGLLSDRVEPGRTTYESVIQQMLDAHQARTLEQAQEAGTPAPTDPLQQPDAEGEDDAEGDPASEESEDFSTRLERLRSALMGAPETSGDLAATPSQPMSIDEVRREASLLFGGDRPVVNSLVTGAAADNSYNERMQDGQRLLADGFWFDAEERFVSALGVRPGDPMAAVGRIHAAMGAGLFRSAASNLTSLLQAHPELAGVRFDAALLPMNDRLGAILAHLRDAAANREDGFARDAGLLLAYLGYQTSSSTDIQAGFDAVDRIDAWLDAPADPLIETLRALWLGDAEAPTERMPAEAASITDYLTDGSLAALCEAVSALAGVTVELHDHADRVVVNAIGERRWAVREAGAGRSGAALMTPRLFAAPIRAGGALLGSLVVYAPGGETPPEDRAPIERVVSLVASIVGELCENQSQLRRRVDELEVLGRLSSMLVASGDPEALLRVAVRAAAETIGADAGTIRILDPSGAALILRSHFGLSDAYILRSVSASIESAPDRAALTGEVVCTEDLLATPDDPRSESRRQEGLRSMISAGLIFQGRPLGIMRLFSRTPRRFSASEQGLLRAIGQQSAAALTNARLLETEKEHRRVRQQVRLAADVQRRLFPRSAPAAPGVEIAARAAPSFELCGDFYDFIELSGHIGVVIGDVVGKGVAAALLMASVRSALRAYAQDLYHLDEVMNRTNQAMCRDTLDNEFATIFYGVLDPATLRFTHCNAGHEPPLVVRPAQRGKPTEADVIELLEAGLVIGIDPTERYQRSHFDLQPGDVMLVFTDGLADARDFSGQKYGKKRIREALLALLTAEPDASADRIADHLIWESRRFVGLNRRTDDTTLVVVRIAPRA